MNFLNLKMTTETKSDIFKKNKGLKWDKICLRD